MRTEPPDPESLRALNRIRIVESGESVVDLRDWCPRLGIRPGIPPLARSSVARRLAGACESVPEGLGLFLLRAYRSPGEQASRWDAYRDRLRALHPEWPTAVLHRETNKAYAPCNQATPPGHTTGGAVDVVFVDRRGEFVDVPPPLERWETGYVDSPLVSGPIRELRAALRDLMESQGFSNYPREYWHYSYGDSAWAARRGLESCPFGALTPEMLEGCA